jgi:hypothetical protein
VLRATAQLIVPVRKMARRRRASLVVVAQRLSKRQREILIDLSECPGWTTTIGNLASSKRHWGGTMRAAKCLRDQHSLPLVEINEASGDHVDDDKSTAPIKLTDAGRARI